jgi:hypothetical protein
MSEPRRLNAPMTGAPNLGNKPGPGRPPGSVNKATTTLRWLVSEIIAHNMANVMQAMDDVRLGKLAPVISRTTGAPVVDPVSGLTVMDYVVDPDPRGFVDLQIKLMEFSMPKLQRSEVVTRDAIGPGEPIPETATPDEANQAYIKLVKG